MPKVLADYNAAIVEGNIKMVACLSKLFPRLHGQKPQTPQQKLFHAQRILLEVQECKFEATDYVVAMLRGPPKVPKLSAHPSLSQTSFSLSVLSFSFQWCHALKFATLAGHRRLRCMG